MLGLTTTDSAKDLSDEEILLRSSAQPWLFGVLLDRYQSAFMRKAMRIVRNERDSEEVVQDAFTKIYQYAHTFTAMEGASFSSWAYKILVNTACTRYQKLVKEGQRFTDIDPEFEEYIGERTNHSGFEEQRDAVERILARLPEHFVLVLRMHYLERYSHEAIALSTGENVGTIKARIHRAKQAFRTECESAGEEVYM
jgi:RNA polymerase sigma-70 factor (ECF subfamily)